jgi:nitroimidazol reductase NimA-like FMN-containing flavoprotein (pyridoxamine 5'-phosphate oxidase superfamily)
MPGYGIAGAREGAGLLPWTWARERLANAWKYFIVTSRPGRPPHAQPVWGIMLGDVFYFSTSPTSAKARNLARDPACTVTVDWGDHGSEEAVVLEGVARIERDAAIIKKFVAVYEPKYDWKLDPIPGDVYAVDPRVVIGVGAEPFAETATRWTFSEKRSVVRQAR